MVLQFGCKARAENPQHTKWHMGHRTSIRFSALPEEWKRARDLKIEIIIKADKNETGK
jgi:hypothetical protein